MKQTLRNLSFFSVLGVALVAMPACSGEDAGPPIGGGNFPSTGGSSTAGTFGNSGTGTTAGTAAGGSAGAGGTLGTGGTFGTAGTGTSGSGGTFGTAGTAAGGGGAGGAGGAAGGTAGAAGTAAGGGGAGGGANGDFPANCPAPTGTHGTTPLTRTCWAVEANQCAATNDNMNPPGQAVDASTTTRFSTGARMLASQTFNFEVDLGSVVMVNGVNVASAATDYAPLLQVATSENGTDFTPVACGPGGLVTDFAFTAKAARYVRLTQHGTAESWWSIHDLNVYASTGDTCAGGGTQMSTCVMPNTQ